jgi:hypothetical protein
MENEQEWNEAQRKEHLDMIKHKLKNRVIKEKLEKHMNEVQKIFECPISISLVFDGNLYSEHIDERDEYLTPKKMMLKDFIDFITEEDQSLYLNIDPIYLKDGINEISNVLITTLGDKAIIVPQIN